MNKVRVIEQSVGCQLLGAWSLVPVIGIGFAVAAIGCYHRVRAEVGHEWNPARAQLVRGVVFAWVGLLINLTILTPVTMRLWFDAST